jgi:hypothetical protein
VILPLNLFNGKSKKWGSLTAASLFFVLFLSLSGCDLLQKAGLLALPGMKKAPTAIDLTSAEPNSLLTKGERYSFYRWLVKEMQEQIMAKPLASNGDVDVWANVLSQKGSLEGVYHGFVLSTEYSAKETGKTDLKAVKFFAAEMAALDNPLLAENDPKTVASNEGYVKEYLNAPLFTLKRVLGEKVLEEAAKRKADSENLAAWYAPFAAKWSRIGIPLGNESRMRGDEGFHFTWAKENTLGLVQWELLNRVHRILNSLGGVALPVPVPAEAPGVTSNAPISPAGK